MFQGPKVFSTNIGFEYTLSKDEQGWYYSPGLGQDFTGMPEYLMEEIQFPDLDAFFGKVYSSMGI